ncbi:MAG: aspartate-alanine antiporter [Lentisphaeria bacterium]|nr:aspartate-alanine antiporter [Lentisphaeria bacterium]
MFNQYKPKIRYFTKLLLLIVCFALPISVIADNHATDKKTTQVTEKVDQKADVTKTVVDAPTADTAPKKKVNWFVNVLRKHTALAIFLTLALGYWIGAIKMGHFSLGAVTGTLLVGVLIGQMDIAVSSEVKSIFFTMFLFAVGYSVGPQFVRGVAHDGAPQAIFAVVICAICIAVTYAAAKIAGFDVGYAAGLWSGGQTISASIGLATDAINSSSSITNKKEMLGHIPVAYAICYLWGTIGTGMILAYLGPTLIGTNLADACKKYEAKMNEGAPEGGMDSAWHQLEARAFKIEKGSPAIGKTSSTIELENSDKQVFIESVRRDDKTLNIDDDDVTIQEGDIVALSGKTESLIELEQKATEVADKDLLNFPMESVDLVVTNKEVSGKTLIDLAKEKFARGVFITKISRGATGSEIPILAKTTIHRGDILTVSGSKVHTKRMEKHLGYVDRTSNETDMVWVGIFIVMFGFLGAISVKLGGVPITLSVSGGVLIGGLVLGWLRSVHPTFGRLPTPTQWFMNSVGLNVFIAIVGISAGPGFVQGLRNEGVGLFIAGLVVTSVPMLAAPLIGKFFFKFDPAINLGCCGGARTSTASVAMVADKAQSNIPMLGYTVPYAVSNTLLTLIGMIIVMIY